ncbi:hypothetical protein NX059_000442 [Plenodomus lindquistii]|nr:hypothetical protein NX059_000442 [Plenodomus lindquistii]
MHQILTLLSCLCTLVAANGGFEKRLNPSMACKTVPGDSAWPSEDTWNIFARQVGGRLIKTTPVAKSCYPGSSYNLSECDNVVEEWPILDFTTANAIGRSLPYYVACPPINHTAGEVPVRQCSLGINPVLAVNATSRSDISATVQFARKNNVRLVTSGTGHDLLGRSDGFGSLELWLRIILSQ